MLAARACFDPKAAITVFTKLGKKEEEMLQGRKVPQFMLTHPLSTVSASPYLPPASSQLEPPPGQQCPKRVILSHAGARAGNQKEPAKGGAGV